MKSNDSFLTLEEIISSVADEIIDTHKIDRDKCVEMLLLPTKRLGGCLLPLTETQFNRIYFSKQNEKGILPEESVGMKVELCVLFKMFPLLKNAEAYLTFFLNEEEFVVPNREYYRKFGRLILEDYDLPYCVLGKEVDINKSFDEIRKINNQVKKEISDEN